MLISVVHNRKRWGLLSPVWPSQMTHCSLATNYTQTLLPNYTQTLLPAADQQLPSPPHGFFAEVPLQPPLGAVTPGGQQHLRAARPGPAGRLRAGKAPEEAAPSSPTPAPRPRGRPRHRGAAAGSPRGLHNAAPRPPGAALPRRARRSRAAGSST